MNLLYAVIGLGKHDLILQGGAKARGMAFSEKLLPSFLNNLAF
jgi:hypothetical protein